MDMNTTAFEEYDGLLCCEDSSEILLSADSVDDESSEMESVGDVDGSATGLAVLIENESRFVPGVDYADKFKALGLDEFARKESVEWILKVQAYYGFQPLTAYLAVNYMDRFLYLRRLPETSGWPIQLLSVACLSLAAKMEESLVPSPHQLQVEGAKFKFEAKTIRRMELLVLSVLDWKLRSITPFNYIDFFAEKLDSSGTYKVFLNTRAAEIILSNIRETKFVENLPSCIAAAGVMCASKDLPGIISLANPEETESWCKGLTKESITGCYQLLQESCHVVKSGKKRVLQMMPHLRGSTISRTSLRSSDELSSSNSSSNTPLFKRRRLFGSLWVVEDENSGSG